MKIEHLSTQEDMDARLDQLLSSPTATDKWVSDDAGREMVVVTDGATETGLILDDQS